MVAGLGNGKFFQDEISGGDLKESGRNCGKAVARTRPTTKTLITKPAGDNKNTCFGQEKCYFNWRSKI